MHVSNAWLPPPVAEKTLLESQAFSEALRCLQQDCSPSQLRASPYASLKWISVFNNFLQCKSELAISDVELFVKVVLGLFLDGEQSSYVQARWGNTVRKYLEKFSKKLSLILPWRQFYDIFLYSNFKRHHSFEGLGLKARHVTQLSSIIRKCRRFFPKGSAAEIWAEFRPMLEDLSQNVSLEGAGLISMFMPVNLHEDLDFYDSKWFAECLELWNGIPYCQIWNSEWASLIGRCICKSSYMSKLEVEQFVPGLFNLFLRSFEVPVGKASGVFPFQREVSREVMLAFSTDWSRSLPKAIAKSIVYLIKPNGSSQAYLSRMVDILEQYYHPSNGGTWTSSLERFLRHIVTLFLERLAKEERKKGIPQERESDPTYTLTRMERRAFVESILRLVERGQFSKSSSLSKTAAMTLSMLAYVEPSLVLPLSITCFQTALGTITATHQLEAAIKTLALSARPLLMFSVKESSGMTIEWLSMHSSDELVASCRNILEVALFDTLSGLDANDPPKTVATLQFFCSVFSSIGKMESEAEGSLLTIDWSQWLDDFLARLFTLLMHLESTNHLVELAQSDKISSSKSFLLQGGSFYVCLLELLLSRLSKPLFEQALKKIAKFVHSNTLTGNVAEIGILCSAVVYANPSQGVNDLLKPMMAAVLSSLLECPPTGFSGIPNSQALFDVKLTLSPALESSLVYQLNLVSLGLTYAGECVIQCKDLLNRIIAASFDAPSAEVNEAGSNLLTCLLGSLVLYYPLDQYRLYQEHLYMNGIEEWFSTKADSGLFKENGPTWHMPNVEEVTFANELLDLHLVDALTSLKNICIRKSSEFPGTPAQEKEHLRVLLLRINGSLVGVRSCLPDFSSPSVGEQDGKVVAPYFIAGAIGASVGSAELRGNAAETLHLACDYFLGNWADESNLLLLLCHSISVSGNCGFLEFSDWSDSKDNGRTELKGLMEPPINYITSKHVKGHRRARWLVIELVILHNTWRASQSQYNKYRIEQGDTHGAPRQVIYLTEDLIKLSLHNYDAIRVMAAGSLQKLFKRFPYAIKVYLPVLLRSLDNPTAPEHAAVGTCALLASRPIVQHLAEDFSSLSSFFLAILNSAHHGTVKAQNAINELFTSFIMRCGGLPKEYNPEHPQSQVDIIRKIQSFCSNLDNTHWRYNIMAQAMLLVLSGQEASSDFCREKTIVDIQSNIKEHFLLNLRSNFPPLRPLSVSLLLFLLQPYHGRKGCSADLEDAVMYDGQVQCKPGIEDGQLHDVQEQSENGIEDMQMYDGQEHGQIRHEQGLSTAKTSLASVLLQEDFGTVVLRNLSLDHHFADAHMQGRQGLLGRGGGQLSNSTMALLSMRSWPRTRTWDSTMKGEGFSSTTAKLFKRLVQQCGPAAVEAFRGPLQGVTGETDERGLQCAAAEVISGFLHSDMECVSKAWEVWLQDLLKKLLAQSSVESTTEWAACIRFAVTGKGRLGRTPPLTRSLVLGCLGEPVSSITSSNALVKHFRFLCAATMEVSPMGASADEILAHQRLLTEALKFVRHSAPQVREVVGMALCIAGANLEIGSLKWVATKSYGETNTAEISDWKSMITNETSSEVLKLQKDTVQAQDEEMNQPSNHAMENPGNGSTSGEAKDAVRFIETVLYFLISTMKSGYAISLMSVIVKLLQPVLTLQETSHKDLSSLAKVALQFLKFQVFPPAQLPEAVLALLAAANDVNWHTRMASLSFLQSFLYRHTYLIPMDCLAKIWSQVTNLLSDAQLEVRELASITLTGMMKGADEQLSQQFYENETKKAINYLSQPKSKRGQKVPSMAQTSTDVHAVVLGLSACVLSVPYDVPRWLPKVLTTLARFSQGSSPAVRSTVKKTIAEFRRTHADTWALQRLMFSEEELEILADTSSSHSYFA